jgi:hypothetical protein
VKFDLLFILNLPIFVNSGHLLNGKLLDVHSQMSMYMYVDPMNSHELNVSLNTVRQNLAQTVNEDQQIFAFIFHKFKCWTG